MFVCTTLLHVTSLQQVYNLNNKLCGSQTNKLLSITYMYGCQVEDKKTYVNFLTNFKTGRQF